MNIEKTNQEDKGTKRAFKWKEVVICNNADGTWWALW
jgi:hypothetical protein